MVGLIGAGIEVVVWDTCGTKPRGVGPMSEVAEALPKCEV